jgi:hypothetical protein
METILECYGETDELLTVSPDGTMKCANVVHLGDTPMDPESEIFHISICSTSMSGKHETFDKMAGKKIKVTVSVE